MQWVIAAVCLGVTVILQAEVALLFIGAGVLGDPLLRQLVFGGLRHRRLQMHRCRCWRTLSRRIALDIGQAAVVLPQGRLAHVRQRPRHRAVSGSKGWSQQYGWLDQRQFLIAVAVGMISPGPVVITATFVGYLVAGLLGLASSRPSASFCRRSSWC